jgi:hypothetical protein
MAVFLKASGFVIIAPVEITLAAAIRLIYGQALQKKTLRI